MENINLCVKKRGSYFINNIVKIVARQKYMTPEMLKMKTRKREIVEARQLAMFLATEYTTASLKTIGSEIGEKDHSTVTHSCKVVNNLQETDRNYRRIYYILKEKVEKATINFGGKKCPNYKMEPPTEIWLQIYDEPINGKPKITWHADKINDTDIRYILDKHI